MPTYHRHTLQKCNKSDAKGGKSWILILLIITIIIAILIIILTTVIMNIFVLFSHTHNVYSQILFAAIYHITAEN